MDNRVNNKKLFSVLGILSVVGLSACNSTSSSDQNQTEQQPVISVLKVLETSQQSAYEQNVKHLQTVIKTSGDWARVWAEHTSGVVLAPQLPTVNFDKERVAGIFSSGNNGCYQLYVSSVKITAEKIEVFYTDEDSDKSALCTTAMVRPAQFISIPVKPEKVIFTKNPPVTHIIIDAPVLLPAQGSV